MEWFYNWGVLRKNRVSELLRSYNLKPKKGKTVDDVIFAFGRGLKDAGHNSKKQIEQIAEEIDKVCVIADWEGAVARYYLSIGNWGNKHG